MTERELLIEAARAAKANDCDSQLEYINYFKAIFCKSREVDPKNEIAIRIKKNRNDITFVNLNSYICREYAENAPCFSRIDFYGTAKGHDGEFKNITTWYNSIDYKYCKYCNSVFYYKNNLLDCDEYAGMLIKELSINGKPLFEPEEE